MAESCKRRYDLLRIKRRCVSCTCRLPRKWAKVRCPTCHGAQLAYHRKWRQDKNTLAERVAALESALADLRVRLEPIG